VSITRKQLYIYVAMALVVTVFGARYVLGGRAAAAPPPGQLLASSPAPTSASTPGGAPSTAPPVVVYVCGAVARPGVYSLDQGSRVADALAAAGGASAKAEMASINLAAKLSDGQQVVVPKKGAAVPAAAPAAGAGGSAAGTGQPTIVNLNTATAAELDALQGVGPSTAQKIIDYRTTNGGFKSVDELKNVAGIGDAKFAALKPYVTVQ
jgi:competence protein ComEA